MGQDRILVFASPFAGTAVSRSDMSPTLTVRLPGRILAGGGLAIAPPVTFMQYNPVAPPANQIVNGPVRITLLTPNMVRLEHAVDGFFEDRRTLAAIHRAFPHVEHEIRFVDESLEVQTAALTIQYRQGTPGITVKNLSIAFKTGTVQGTWHPGMNDPLNLHGTTRTLDKCRADTWVPEESDLRRDPHLKETKLDLGAGLISRSGWAVVNDSNSIVLDNDHSGGWAAKRSPSHTDDLYFLAYGHDYLAALKDGARLFGQQPMLPRFALGYWWCRYWVYTDKEFEELVEAARQFGVPMDVLVMDMDWHRQNWTGFSWERSYFPDPDEFLAWTSDQALRVALNLHPADGTLPHEDQYDAMAEFLGQDPAKKMPIPFDCTCPRNMDAYFNLLLRPLEKQGVRFWWLDWQQGDKSAMEGLDPLPWLNHLHWEDQAAAYPERRPICYSRYGGIGAGRYPVGFSGDTYVCWESLAYQPYFTATASNVLYGYWSHDIGAHFHGHLDGELYARWVQFGAYSPVLRTHGTKMTTNDRRVWDFPTPYREALIATVRHRYELIPYIYTECRHCLDEAVSLCRPMYYHYPEIEAAYHCPGQYMFGSQMVACPVTSPCEALDDLAAQQAWIPEGKWFDTTVGTVLDGPCFVENRYTLEEIPVFVKAGAVIPGMVGAERTPKGSYPRLLATAHPGGNGRYRMYEDDGESEAYRSGEYAWIPFDHTETQLAREVRVGPAEGSFRGFENSRSLEVRLVGAPPPREVSVNGEHLPFLYRLRDRGWNYDAASATILVKVSRVDVLAQNSIKVAFADTSGFALVAGLPGVFSRLRQAYQTAKVLEVQWERRVAYWMQTANRISRDPNTFASEAFALRKALTALEAQYEEIKRQVVCSGQYRPTREDVFEKVWRQVMTAAQVLSLH